MILIQNIKEHPGKDGKPFDTFTILGTFEGQPVEVKGWRYFHESKDVKPPSMRVGPTWQPTFRAPDKLHEAIKKAYEASVLGNALEDYETVSDAWESFRTLVREGREEEALAAFTSMKSLTLGQQIVLLLLEVRVNPLTCQDRDAVEVFGGLQGGDSRG